MKKQVDIRNKLVTPDAQSFAGYYPEISDAVLKYKDKQPDLPFRDHLSIYRSLVANEYRKRTPDRLVDPNSVFLLGIGEICGAINGVQDATAVYYPGIDKCDKVDISRRSYGVLVAAVMDDTLFDKSRNRMTIPTERLKASDHGEPRIVVDRSVPTDESRVYESVPCPAFLGTVPSQFRLPHLMWNTLIDIYDIHGMFEDGKNVPVKTDSQEHPLMGFMPGN